jgi:hypothetical protein
MMVNPQTPKNSYISKMVMELSKVSSWLAANFMTNWFSLPCYLRSNISNSSQQRCCCRGSDKDSLRRSSAGLGFNDE